MHQRARGHEVEPENSHFLCPKTKRSKTREKGATGESYAPTCKRTRGRAQPIPFFYVQKEKQGRKVQLGRVMHVRTRGHRKQLSLITPIFYVQKRKRKTREKGATGESMHEGARGHEAERSHSHFLCSQQKEITIRESWALYAIL